MAAAKIPIKSDIFEGSKGSQLSFLGPSWLFEHRDDWENLLWQAPDYVAVDLSGISFVTLADWVYFVAYVDTVIENSKPRQFDLDILGNSSSRLIDSRLLPALERGEQIKGTYTRSDLNFSKDRYRLVGFLETLDTYGVLNRPGRGCKVIYPGLSRQTATIRNYYAARPQDDKPTVVLGLHRIDEKEDCKLFLNDSQILNWRRAMDRRFRSSPLFESGEVWRVLCHELALNIWEHAGSPGFVAGRVVELTRYH